MPGPMGGGRNMQFDPNQKMDLKALAKLAGFAKSFLPAIIIVVLCSLLSTVPSIIGPRKISDLMNIITSGVASESGVDMNAFRSSCAFLLVLYAAGALIGYIQQWVMVSTTQGVARKLRTSLNDKLNRLALRFFDSSTRGDILSRFTNDVDTISQALSQTIATLLSAILLFVGVITGVGGGVLRDVFCGAVPSIFREHIYALASAAGAVCYILLLRTPLPEMASMLAGFGVVFIIRCLAAHYHWNLPKVEK